MGTKPAFWGSVVAVLLLGASVQAQDGLFFVDTFSGGQLGDKVGLQRVGLYRGGELYTYRWDDEIIRSNLTAINSTNSTVLLYANPFDGNGSQAMNDQFLNTGLYRLSEGGGDFSSGENFFKQTFEAPIVNGPGTDLIVVSIEFDFDTLVSNQTDYFVSFDGLTSQLVEEDENDEFRLSTVESIPLYSLGAGITDPSDLGLATNPVGGLGNDTALPQPVLRELDLSDFGVAPGASITDIWIQDSDGNGNGLFPTMVFGLPDIPEPSSLVLLSAALLAIRRR